MQALPINMLVITLHIYMCVCVHSKYSEGSVTTCQSHRGVPGSRHCRWDRLATLQLLCTLPAAHGAGRQCLRSDNTCMRHQLADWLASPLWPTPRLGTHAVVTDLMLSCSVVRPVLLMAASPHTPSTHTVSLRLGTLMSLSIVSCATAVVTAAVAARHHQACVLGVKILLLMVWFKGSAARCADAAGVPPSQLQHTHETAATATLGPGPLGALCRCCLLC